MTEGILYYFTKPDLNRPIEEQYVAEIDGVKKSFVNQEDAILYLFDNGVNKFKRLTKELHEYKNPNNLPTYELWHIENRVGYVLHGHESYVNENNKIKKRKAYIWRFVGFGQSCFAKTEDKLKEKVKRLIQRYEKKPKEFGYNTYPYFTQYFRS